MRSARIINKSAAWLLFSCITGVLVYCSLCWFIPHWYQSKYTFESKSDAPKILVVWYRGIGEQETIERLKITAKRIGIDLRVATTGPRLYIRHFVKDPVNVAKNIFKPDFILTIQDWVPYFPGVPNYMTLTLGTERYLDFDEESARVEIINKEHQKFDALLPSFKHIEQLQLAYESSGKKFNGFSWYPTAYKTDYLPAVPYKLFYSGGFLWDETRGGKKYRELFSLLDQTGYFQVCGPKRKWKHTPNSAVGFIPVDGVSLLEAHHNAGVALLLHHQLHVNGAAPTGRIFEAAAANTVIISDKHPFIQENFGDNILYVDTDQTAEEMFNQINSHMQWILGHPQEAQKMAANCNAIYKAKFSMEAQLAKLIDMHKVISSNN